MEPPAGQGSDQQFPGRGPSSRITLETTRKKMETMSPATARRMGHVDTVDEDPVDAGGVVGPSPVGVWVHPPCIYVYQDIKQ